ESAPAHATLAADSRYRGVDALGEPRPQPEWERVQCASPSAAGCKSPALAFPTAAQVPITTQEAVMKRDQQEQWAVEYLAANLSREEVEDAERSITVQA